MTMTVLACVQSGVIVLLLALLGLRARRAGDDGARTGRFFASLRRAGRARIVKSGSVFVAVCEFDRFEAIRRNVGFATANAIIARAAGEISRVLPAAEIGRTHRTSIEFASPAAGGDVAGLLAGLARAFDQPIVVEGCAFNLSPRFGFAVANSLLGHDELIERAGIALQDRASAGERIIDATRDPDGAVAARLRLLRDLHQAIDADALELHYQPKLRCRTETIDSVEALLRWDHPHLGPVRPDEFVAMAEETGLIRRLTEWTLARAIRDQRLLAEAGHPLMVHVNISGLLLPDDAFAREALRQAAAAPGGIGFEITETAVIGHPEKAIANLRAFAAAGIRIAIDDYGSGLSSLAYLKQLPAHELKIDRLFISGLTSSHRDPLLVRSSIDLAHALEMEVTAEGVDNPMALSLLRVMGCDLIQGFFVARPMSRERLIRFLDTAEYAGRIAAPALPRFGAIRDAG